MHPYIQNNDLLYIDHSKNITNGDLVIFLLNKKVFIRWYYKNDNLIFLISEKEYYFPTLIKRSDSFDILGKVIKIEKNFPKKVFDKD